MKAKDVILKVGEKDLRLGNMSNNVKCSLIIQLINERNALKKELEKYSSNNIDNKKIG